MSKVLISNYLDAILNQDTSKASSILKNIVDQKIEKRLKNEGTYVDTYEPTYEDMIEHLDPQSPLEQKECDIAIYNFAKKYFKNYEHKRDVSFKTRHRPSPYERMDARSQRYFNELENEFHTEHHDDY